MTRRMLLVFCAFSLSLGSACAVINQNEVGVRRTNGKLQPDVLTPGRYYVGPLTTMLKLPVNTINLEIKLPLPSREGLSVDAEISILYRINPKMAHKILSSTDDDYERTIILSSFRSSAADVCARFMAKDMHSGARAVIEKQINDRMTELLAKRGFIIEAVLLKSIRLPRGLSRSIEQRLSAEQDALRMKYILQQEHDEAKRKMIEAKGISDANKILNAQLTEKILRLRALEAFIALASSPNSKIVITDSKSPLFTPLTTETPTPLRKTTPSE